MIHRKFFVSVLMLSFCSGVHPKDSGSLEDSLTFRPRFKNDQHIESSYHRARGKRILQDSISEPSLRLEDLERLALKKNPTIPQAAAAIREAQGREVQAGLYPNPILGYTGQELQPQVQGKTSEHFLFIEQTIVTGGKLRLGRNIFAQERLRAEIEQQAQIQRVLNTVRMIYYEVLGAQRLVDLRAELASIANEAVEISEELWNIGQADWPDVLEAEVEAHQAEMDLMSAQNRLEQAWELMAAVVGDPTLSPARLLGDLEADIPQLDQETALARLLGESLEIKVTQVAVERARAALKRARADRIPNILFRVAFGYNYEQFAPGERVGLEGAVQVGIAIPLFNRNQGNIASAQADIDRAQLETQRQSLALRARLSSTFRTYLMSLRIAERYREEILPRARNAYELYLKSFEQMAAAYPQVLIAQRTLFQANVNYVQALVDVWQSVIQIQGLLLTGGLDAPNLLSIRVQLEPGTLRSVPGEKNVAMRVNLLDK